MGPILSRIADRDDPAPTERYDLKGKPIVESDDNLQCLNIQFRKKDRQKVIKPNELESQLKHANIKTEDELFNAILGSMMGLAIGDALGAPVEFRPNSYLEANEVVGFQEGGTWSLSKGQFTDDTSMALCLAISLICRNGFNLYDQLVRYKWWHNYGYMSSAGECFDIGEATRAGVSKFEQRQSSMAQRLEISIEEADLLPDDKIPEQMDWRCGDRAAAGNGSLMRLAPVALFFHRDPIKAVDYCGQSSYSTHADPKAVDACRFYGALIVGALHKIPKQELLSPDFYEKHRDWFGGQDLQKDILLLAKGSFRDKKGGYKDGIRGTGYVVNSLEAALWAFDNDDGSFKKGILSAVNLGDDTDTTAAIYGQLAGAYYGYEAIPSEWRKNVYASKFITFISEIIYSKSLEINSNF